MRNALYQAMIAQQQRPGPEATAQLLKAAAQYRVQLPAQSDWQAGLDPSRLKQGLSASTGAGGKLF